MDWPRFLRAMAASQIEAIEDRRRLYMADKIQADALTAEDWERIREHDEWLSQI